MPSNTDKRAELPPLRDVIKQLGLGAKKSFGQHFLLDSNLTDRIARAAGDLSKKTVIEVGPGPGGLTRSLLAQSPGRLIAIERDHRCIDALQPLRHLYPDTFELIEADALKLGLDDLGPEKKTIVSNLPYNVGTPLLINWLRQAPMIERMVLMFQSEVAERLAAQPGTPAYGRLSVLAQWLCDVKFLFQVDKKAFTPPPKVMSAVVSLEPRPAPLADVDMSALEKVTQAAFGQRRKMLRRSLRSLELDPARANIDPVRRAETLSVEEFCKLAALL